MPHYQLRLLLILSVLLGCLSVARAGLYNFATLDIPNSAAFDINDDGHIVGTTGVQGFILRDGVFHIFSFPGAFLTTAFGINNDGQIVGSGSLGSFLLDEGLFSPIDPPGSGTTSALDINNHGQIVGVSGSQGFLLEEGVFHFINVPGSSDTLARGINDLGQIVGDYFDPDRGTFRGFLLENGVFRLIDVPCAGNTTPTRINNHGQIVGMTGGHGFLLQDGAFTLIDVPGASATADFGINDLGQLVGRYFDSTGSHGFVATPQVIVVPIDIKPGTCLNKIDLKSKEVIPVAILTTATLDATTIDPLSMEFGPNGATEAHGRGHIEDVNKDGRPDLVLHFNIQETGIQCGDTSVLLTGQIFSREKIGGTDAITTVGCK
jgi:hypothetical protein